jgi:hypothetical protein
MLIISMQFFVVPGVIKLRMLRKLAKKILKNSNDQVTVCAICIHIINWIYTFLERERAKIIALNVGGWEF